MARVTIIIDDQEGTVQDPDNGIRVQSSFDPPPLTTDPDQQEITTLAQVLGMDVVEKLMGYPLQDEDFCEPTYH